MTVILYKGVIVWQHKNCPNVSLVHRNQSHHFKSLLAAKQFITRNHTEAT